MNPLRFLKNLLVDFLLMATGTYVGAPPQPNGAGSSGGAEQAESGKD